MHISGLKYVTAFLLLFLINQDIGYSQKFQPEKDIQKKHSLYTDPTLVFFDSYVIFYGNRLNQQNGIVTGFWYNKADATYPKELKYPGYVQSYSALLGYRRYFWKNLHAEYQLYPGLSIFHEETLNKAYNSFTLFNEFRVGYRFDFLLFNFPLLLNLQWPAGFTLYNSNEPESFNKVSEKDPVFYIFFPNIYLGIRF